VLAVIRFAPLLVDPIEMLADATDPLGFWIVTRRTITPPELATAPPAVNPPLKSGSAITALPAEFNDWARMVAIL